MARILPCRAGERRAGGAFCFSESRPRYRSIKKANCAVTSEHYAMPGYRAIVMQKSGCRACGPDAQGNDTELFGGIPAFANQATELKTILDLAANHPIGQKTLGTRPSSRLANQHAGPKLSGYAASATTTVAQNATPGFLRDVIAYHASSGDAARSESTSGRETGNQRTDRNNVPHSLEFERDNAR